MLQRMIVVVALCVVLVGTVAWPVSGGQDRQLESEAYVLKQWETTAASTIGRWMRYYGAPRAGGDVNDSDWTRENNRFWLGEVPSRRNRRNSVIFSAPSYTNAKVTYGETRTLQQDKVEVEGFSRTFDNRAGVADTDELISETVGLTSEVSHTLDVGLSAEISSRTQVSGTLYGIEFETELTATLGTTVDNSQTEAESQTRERAVEHAVTVEAGTRVQVAFETNAITTETPFCIDGTFDLAIVIDFEDWACGDWARRYPDHRCHELFGARGHTPSDHIFQFATVLEFERLFKGFDPEHSDMGKRPLPDDVADDIAAGMEWIFDPDNRQIEACGTKRRVYEDNVDVVTRLLE